MNMLKVEPIDAAILPVWYGLPPAVRNQIRKYILLVGQFHSSSAFLAYKTVNKRIVQRWLAPKGAA